jgi:hypothetical protein
LEWVGDNQLNILLPRECKLYRQDKHYKSIQITYVTMNSSNDLDTSGTVTSETLVNVVTENIIE